MAPDTNISPEVMKSLYKTMLRIRLFEDGIVDLYGEQEMKTPVHLCIGQEAIAAAVCSHLRREDHIFSTHRSHGHCIAKGMDFKPIAAELYGRVTGCSKGRGGSMHLVDPEHGIPGSTAIVGGCIPLAVGAALSAVKKGEDRIAVAFFGDGATEEGTFHESLNYASLKRLPVVFVCENNFYATNSPISARQPDVGIAVKAAGYGVPGVCVDGNDVLPVYRAAKEAVEKARRGEGPSLLECRTYRWKGHVGPNSDIEAGCRPADEHEEWLRKCPLDAFGAFLLDIGVVSDKDVEGMVKEIAVEIAEAMTLAKSGAPPDPSSLMDFVY